MTKAIHDKDLKLLKVCNVTNYYPILLDVINNYPEIQIEELHNISSEHVRFFENMYNRVKKQAFKEWTGSIEKDIKKFKKSDNKRCYICNHPLEFVCTIHNRLNGKKIDIGKDCNKHFGIYKEKDIENILEDRRKLIKLDELDKRFPKLLTIINNWLKIIDEEELYIFKFIKEKYLEIGIKLNSLHKEYIEKKTSIIRENEILNEIDELLIQGNKEKEKIKEFIQDKKDLILYPTKKMVNSLKNKQGYTGVEWLEEDGKITWRTLHRFRDEQFCNRLIDNFNSILFNKGITIEKFKRYKEYIGYSIVSDKNKECKLFCKYEDLCFLCGGEITNESEKIENFTYKKIIKESSLVDEYSIEFGLSKIEYIISNKGIELEQYFHEFEDVIWKFKKGNSDKAKCYYKTKISNIQNILKDLLYDMNEYNENKLFNLLIKNSSKLQNGDAYDLMKRRN